MLRTLTRVILVFTVVTVITLAPTSVYAFDEDVLNAIGLVSNISNSGSSWTGTGACFATPPEVISDSQTSSGTYHGLVVGESAVSRFVIADPDGRARIIRFILVGESGEISRSEVECRDISIVEFPLAFDEPGVYWLLVYLDSKVRGRTNIPILGIGWNKAVIENTAITALEITVYPNNYRSSTETSSSDNDLYLCVDGHNFGSEELYYVSGIPRMEIWSDQIQDWTVADSSRNVENITDESFLVLEPISTGVWTFNDRMTIVVTGANYSEAEAESSIEVNYNPDGTLMISSNAYAYAYNYSSPSMVIGISSVGSDSTINNRGAYYQPNARIYGQPAPRSHLYWYFDQETCRWEDPTCGPPPDDWDWEPPVPPPPSQGWEPDVPPPPPPVP